MNDIGGLGTGVNTDDLGYHSTRRGSQAKPYKSDSANEWFYKKQEAELNHRYALDAWERENEYNLPINVAERLRDAGINPRVAFGNGSGVGGDVEAGSASGSYGRSDDTQSIERATQIAGIVGDAATRGMDIAQRIGGLTNLSAQTEKTKAETQGVQTENKYKETQILSDLRKQQAEIDKILSDTKLSDEQRKTYEAQREYIAQQILESQQNIRASQQGVVESGQRVKESRQRIKESEKRVDKLAVDIRKEEVVVDLMKNKVETEKMDRALKEAQKGHTEALKNQVEKEVEFIGKKMDLTDQQIKESKNRIARQWAEYGATVAKMTSEEVRKWVIGWIPGTQKDAPTTFNSYDPFDYPSFAD